MGTCVDVTDCVTYPCQQDIDSSFGALQSVSLKAGHENTQASYLSVRAVVALSIAADFIPKLNTI